MIEHERQKPSWLQDAVAQLAAQREAKKQEKQQAADDAALRLARERIRSQDARQGI
jgi:hypothetical protein